MWCICVCLRLVRALKGGGDLEAGRGNPLPHYAVLALHVSLGLLDPSVIFDVLLDLPLREKTKKGKGRSARDLGEQRDKKATNKPHPSLARRVPDRSPGASAEYVPQPKTARFGLLKIAALAGV